MSSTASLDVSSTTVANVAKEARDNMFESVPLLSEIKKNGGVVTVQGGETIDFPVIVSEHSTMTEHATGYEQMNLDVADVMEKASYRWADLSQPVMISRSDAMENRGPEKRADLIRARADQVLGSIGRRVESAIIRGVQADEPIASLSDLNGGGTLTGWLEEAAFGSQTSTVGGLAKGTYPTVWQNQVEDVASTFSATGLLRIRELFISMQHRADVKKWLVLASHNSYALYGDTLQTQEQYGNKDTMDGSRFALLIGGQPIYPSGDLGFTATGGVTPAMSMYFLNMNDIKLYVCAGNDFDASPFMQMPDRPVKISHVYIKMQLVAKRLNTSGLLMDAEA